MRRELLIVLAACAHPAPRGIERDLDREEPVPPAAPTTTPTPPPDDLLAAPSVAFTVPTPVRAEASNASARIGIIGRDARAKALDAKPPGDGCEQRWIAIAPRGWVCATNLAPTHDPPTEPTAVALDDATDPELGTYAAIRGDTTLLYEDRADIEAGGGHRPDGAMLVRSTGGVTIDGVRYRTTSDGSLVEERALAALTPSRFHGVALAAGELHVGWAIRARHPRSEVTVLAAPSAHAAAIGALAPRTQVAILETSADGRFVRVGDHDWIARADLRTPTLATELPPDVSAHERWFDVDLAAQILVAYEGRTPAYATLVSTGRVDHRTAPAVARIAFKLRSTTMASATADAYSVADVPWAMYYDDTLALHGAYWHDSFGERHSHGCINLAPRDARILYDWSSPDVPPGWTAVYATPSTPGTLVRIHE